MASTFDRDGGNKGADASNYVYMIRDAQSGRNRSVVFDIRGAGAMLFARFQHWHGSPWVLEIDDQPPFALSESNTKTQSEKVDWSVFYPQAAFPNGSLTQTFSSSKGGDVMWVPITFSKSLRLSYEQTHYGSGYEIIHRLPKLPPGIEPWTPAQVPPAPAVAVLEAAGNGKVVSLLPALQTVGGNVGVGGCAGGSDTCKKGGDFGSIHGGCSPSAFCQIRRVSLSAPSVNASHFGNLTLELTFDSQVLLRGK